MLFEPERRDVSLTSPPDWLVEYLGGGASYSGENVTVDRALTVPAVLAGFSILLEDTSSLPLILYRRLARGKERASNNPLYFLLHNEPNTEMTSMVYREILMGHLLGWGNSYSQKIWDTRGRLTALYPLNPSSMEIARENGERKYLYRTNDGRRIAFTQEEIWHIPAFGFDGVKGFSRISMARNSIGLALTTEKFGSRVFSNGARPDVILTYPRQLDPKQQKLILDSWNQTYGGSSNAAKTAILEEGLDIKTLGFPPEDAQFIETQKWTVQQIARVFRIPPHMLGDVERSTSWGSGIEQQELGYVTHTLRPWTVRIEQQANKDLLLQREKPEYFFEHLFDELLRTDTKSRMEAYAIAITNGVITRNEARERENLLPYKGGDEPLYPLNMTSATNPPQNEPAPQRDITPLLMDAARRISKRDENELSGALKRYAEKEDRFNQWLEQFYKSDFPTFIRATFQPLVDSHLIPPGAVRAFIADLIEKRGISIDCADYSPIEPDVILTLLQEAHHA